MTRILLALSTLAVIVVTWILLTPGDERIWLESSKGTASSIPEHEAALGRDSVSGSEGRIPVPAQPTLGEPVDAPLEEPMPESSSPVEEPASPHDNGWPDMDKVVEAYPLPIYDWEGELPRRQHLEYEAKYHGFNEEELADARYELTKVMNKAMESAFDERWANGDITSLPIQYETDEKGNLSPIPFGVQNFGNAPLSKVKLDKSSEDSVYEFAWLDPSQYADVYLYQDETAWLTYQIGKLNYQAQD